MKTSTARLSAAITLAISTLAAGTAAQAADPNAPSPNPALDTIVVTATGHAQSAVLAPASISIIPRAELETRPFTDLQDALETVPGVAVTGADVNKKDIAIRGMPGDYTLILVDGIRQSTRGNSHREITGAAQSAQIPPLEAIERIEVVRGPMSSLYGSDAIGGVVNIITRPVTNVWTGAFDLDTTAQQHSDLGNARGGDFYLAGPLKQDVAGLQVWGKINDRTESEVIDGAYGTRDEGGTARLTLMPSSNQTLRIEAGWHALKFHSTEGRTHVRPAGPMDLKYERTHYSLQHEGHWGFGDSHINLQREIGDTHQSIDGLPSGNYPSNRVTNTVLDGNVSLPFTHNTLTLGGQLLEIDLTGLNHEGNNTLRGLDNTSWALFAENEYRPIENLTLTAGLRYNHDERYGSNWSPRLYAVYQISDQWVLRGGIGRGFRAPTLRETAPEYVAITGVGHIGVPRGTLPGNPDLDPETSTNTEIGIRYVSPGALTAGLTLFNNDFTNKIFSECVLQCTGASGATYAWGNIGKARIRGAELSVAWPLSDTVNVQANYTYTDSERLTDEEYAFNGESLRGEPLARTPRNAANVRVNWDTTNQLTTWVAVHGASAEYWANFRNGAEWVRRRPGSTTGDLGATYRFNDKLSVRAAILNVTDQRVPVDRRNRLTGLDGNWQVDEGRRVWLSVGFGF